MHSLFLYKDHSYNVGADWLADWVPLSYLFKKLLDLLGDGRAPAAVTTLVRYPGIARIVHVHVKGVVEVPAVIVESLGLSYQAAPLTSCTHSCTFPPQAVLFMGALRGFIRLFLLVVRLKLLRYLNIFSLRILSVAWSMSAL